MQLIVCLDEQNGMLFNHRRQTKDREVRRRILESLTGNRLWMNAYSAGQFEEETDRLAVAEDFLNRAGEQEVCFVEDRDILPFLEQIQSLTVYRWHRRYPSDMKFPMQAVLERLHPVSSTDFPGHSHDVITMEVYAL